MKTFVCLVVLLTVIWLYCVFVVTGNVGDYIKQHGLKGVVEEIWHGEKK